MNTPVARRYAQALYDEAARREQVEAIDEDVATLRKTLAETRELSRFFESPVISRERKEAVIRSLFEERLDSLTLRFLLLLVQKEREDHTASILDTYQQLRDEQRNIVAARARVPRPLSSESEAELVQTLEQITGKNVRLITTEDASLIGGVIVRIGDTVYDGSVRHQLRSLRERMAHGTAANGQG